MTKKILDGGYYAIKGFMYQMDKTILAILDNSQSEISFEQKQDIDFDDDVIQVKYKEGTTYSPSQIKKPVIQLLELFKNDKTKKYYIYCYFRAEPEGPKKITLKELDTILGKDNKFDQNLKNSFISNFILNFSQNFYEHFENVIEKIRTEFSYTSDEEALFAHGVILDHLFRKITSNKDENTPERKCSKTELQSILSNHKSCLFYSAYRDFLTEKKYFSLIKQKYFTWRNIDDFERFIIIELRGNETLEQIKSAVLSVKNKFYCPQNRAIKSGAPYVYFRNIADDKLRQIKHALNEEGYSLKDGHDFLSADFSVKSLKEPSTKENGVCLKFINTKEHFFKMLDEKLGKTKEIYQFFLNNPFEIESDNKNIKIQIQNLSDILSIL